MTTKEWSEEEEHAAFNNKSITVRTPPKKCITPAEVQMAPKKKETTLPFNPSELPTDESTVPETPPSMARNTSEGMTTRGKATKPAPKTAQANNSLLSTVETASKMPASGKATTRTSGRNADTSNNNELIKKAEAAIAMLQKPSLSGDAKTNIAALLEEMIESLKQLPTAASHAEKATEAEPTIAFKEKDLKALDKKMDLIVNILTKEPPKSWAQMVAAPPPSATKQPAAMKQHFQEARKDRSQYEVTLTTSDAPASTHELIKSTPHKDISDRLQKMIDKATLPGKPRLEGVNKLGRDIIRMRVETKEGAKTIKETGINWDDAYPGIRVYKPKYGVVVHGVPTQAINFDTDDYSETKDEWQRQNTNSKITITNITTLRKARQRHRATAHRSIVVFTEDAEAADHCIQHGFFIDKQILKAERYAPHLHITQCYKCHGYGHRATNCKKKEKCGKCAEEHPTAECTSDTPKCVNCDGKHEAWHIECMARSTEGKRLTALRMETSPYYTV
jgi:hypothetical protein